MQSDGSLSNQAAAWVGALGTIAAVVGASWVAASESRAARRRDERAEAAVAQREARDALATRTAALNLAILASTQIHDLHVVLKEESWRGRVARVSPSRAFLATERMLTAFPIQSMGEAAAMIEFSRFPASLAMAAEVYANLEKAVRAAPEPDRDAIFEACNRQMENLDNAAKQQLISLTATLKLGSAETST